MWQGTVLTVVRTCSFLNLLNVYSTKGQKVDIYNTTLTQFQPYGIEWLECGGVLSLLNRSRDSISPPQTFMSGPNEGSAVN